MANEINIRYAGPADAALVAELSRKTFFDTFASMNTKEDMELFLDTQFTIEKLVEEVSSPGNIFLLAFINNETAGYARLREDNNPEQLRGLPTLEIARIYALSDFIGKGVGKALMEKSFAIAKEKNKKWVWLGVWKENHRAVQFYKKYGFEIFGEHDFVLGKDIQKDWLMKKELI